MHIIPIQMLLNVLFFYPIKNFNNFKGYWIRRGFLKKNMYKNNIFSFQVSGLS